MEKVLIDTDVLLDFFFGRQPFVEYASEILNRCKKNKIEGFTTPVIVANTYYLLRKTAPHEVVVERLNQLLSFIQITTMNRNVVMKALNSEFRDFEDALQNFSAIETQQIDLILTRNIKDFRKSELIVLTPKEYIKGGTILEK